MGLWALRTGEKHVNNPIRIRTLIQTHFTFFRGLCIDSSLESRQDRRTVLVLALSLLPFLFTKRKLFHRRDVYAFSFEFVLRVPFTFQHGAFRYGR